MAKIKTVNINAGHNASGKVSCGAIGFLDESKENRRVAKVVIEELEKKGVKTYNCTVNDAPSQRENLRMIANKCNEHSVDLNVFIHFNSGVNDKTGNGKTTGTEVLICSKSGLKTKAASAIRKEICKLGYKDRGTKLNYNLYVLNHTKAPAILIECCFVDDKDDAKLYNHIKMGKAIAKGILSVNI